ncbi:MAG: TetR/AcrR family transcriptional regulator [Neisseriaceae bacterium]
METSSKENTYERIIQASIKLFNERGERYVTTNHIVAHLGISPGNLYYYFKNKEAIIEEIFKRYEKELLAFIGVEVPQTEIEDALHYVGKIFDTMWNYRFIFMDLGGLFSRSKRLKALQKDYTLNRVEPLISGYLQALVDKGRLHMSAVDLKVFKHNFWLLCRYWYSYDKLRSGTLGSTSSARGSLLALGLLKPYLDEKDKETFDEYYSKKFQDMDW